MAETKATSEGTPSVKQLVLRVTPKEASEVIAQQLRSGKRIVRQLRPQSSEEQLLLIASDLHKWDNYNSTLLRTVFTTPSFASKYVVCQQSFASARLGSLQDYRRELIMRFHRKRTELESINEQLVLFDKAPQSVSRKDEGVATANTVSSDKVEGAIDKKNVVVVYGRNEKLKNSMFDFLNAVGLKPLDWIQLKTDAIKSTGKGTPYTGEIVAKAFGQRAVVVLLTGDDKAILRKKFWEENDPPYERELAPQARPNVLFEAGMAIGRSDERTILVEIGTVRPWTDIAGRHVTRFDGTPQKRHELIEQLKAIDCEVDTAGSRWMDVGDFEEEPDSQEGDRSSEEPITARGKRAFTQRSRRPHVESKIKIGRAENTKVTGVDYSGRSSTPATKSHVQIHEIKGGEATGVQSKETDNQVKG